MIEPRIKNDSKLIPVSMGDRIRVVFNHHQKHEERERVGVVLSIKRRYGHYGKFIRESPLLHVKWEGQTEFESFDQSFVVEVLGRYQGPKRLPVNVFRDTTSVMRDRLQLGWEPIKRGVWYGSLTALTHYVLSTHHARITHPLDEGRLRWMFADCRPGLIRKEYGMVVVKSEPFKRWVRQNYQKFLATTAELDREGTRENKESALMMEADMDMLDDFEQSDGSDEIGAFGNDFDY